MPDNQFGYSHYSYKHTMKKGVQQRKSMTTCVQLEIYFNLTRKCLLIYD
jgi:hypothetical protein